MFLILLLAGSISLSLTMVKSGLIYDFGMGFWGPNGHDGIWHISLINQLSKFSLNHPTFAGKTITNYHFGFDLLVALLSRLTGIIPVSLYFQVLPPLIATLIGVLTYYFVFKWTKSRFSAWWATFFVYFGGSLGWLVTFVRYRTFGGESMFWANQAISTLINPPYALSLVIILVGLIRFLDYLEKPNWKNLFVCCFLFGILIQIKVYAGIIILLSLFSSVIYFVLFDRKKTAVFWKLFLSASAISSVVFLPFNFKSGSLLVFSPLWFPRTMLAFQDRFFWPKLESAREVYLITHKWLKWFLAELAALGIFLVGNLGTRVIGFITILEIIKKFRRLKEIEYLIFSFLFFSLILPLLFIQKGNPWNTIQFFYYFQFLMAILSGIVFGKWLEKKLKSPAYYIFIYVTAIMVIGLTVLTTLATLKNDYLPGRPPARISVEELEALEFLKNESVGVVLTYPFQSSWRFKFTEPRPLYAYETTAYVSALTGKQAYLEDEMNLEISGYDWQSRRKEEEKFFPTDDKEWANYFIRTNKIKYIYLIKGQKINLGEGDIGAQKVFENGEVKIFEIK